MSINVECLLRNLSPWSSCGEGFTGGPQKLTDFDRFKLTFDQLQIKILLKVHCWTKRDRENNSYLGEEVKHRAKLFSNAYFLCLLCLTISNQTSAIISIVLQGSKKTSRGWKWKQETHLKGIYISYAHNEYQTCS